MDSTKKQLIERLKEANNILVTVSQNPSVDQLAAAIGMTLALNKLGKHGTAVFSGSVPSTIEFLQPEDTIEKNTDSLRDFIISLDKSKADKLRYKVEDKMVKIFITPYRTSISDADLVFSQGDFNVDVVIALGVHRKEELDEAITSHGRILHDATVSSLNNTENGQLGSINWIDTNASSLCEMAAGLSQSMKEDVVDAQIATAFLTGIVAETERFSNEKTTSDTMKLSAALMAAGANQQLVATKLQEPVAPFEQEKPQQPVELNNVLEPKQANVPDDGTLDVGHRRRAREQPDQVPYEPAMDQPDNSSEQSNDNQPIGDETAEPDAELPEPAVPGQSDSKEEDASQQGNQMPKFMREPPTIQSHLTANTQPYYLDSQPSPLDLPASDRAMPYKDDSAQKPDDNKAASKEEPNQPPDAVVEESAVSAEAPDIAEAPELPVPTTLPPSPDTLKELEQAVHSPHQENAPHDTPDEEAARAAVKEAMQSGEPQKLEPEAALNAGGHMEIPHQPVDASPQNPPNSNGNSSFGPNDTQHLKIDPNTGELSYHAPNSTSQSPMPSVGSSKGDVPEVNDPTAPPPVPPPLLTPVDPPADDNGNFPG